MKDAAATPSDRAPEATAIPPEFLGALSHELRSPLNVILGYGELLRDGTLGPINDRQRDALERIGRNAGVLLSRLTDVLDYCRLQAGSFVVTPVRVSIGELLEARIAEQETRRASAPEIAIHRTVAAGLPAVAADPEMLATIVDHLLRNALRYGAAAPIEVAAEGRDGGVLVSVRDRGCGIPEDRQSDIFLPFVKVSPTEEKGFRDLGLGLFIARGYAEAMHGTLAVESRVGEGAVFRLWLPAYSHRGKESAS